MSDAESAPARSSAFTEGITAAAVHSLMLAGLLMGRWNAGATVVGVLLDSLVAYALWLYVYLRLRPVEGVKEVLAKTFIGLSLGVWGFIGMFRAISLKDSALLAVTTAVLQGAGSLGDIDGDGAVIVLLIIAVLLFIASLYFLGKILITMAPADLCWLGLGVAVFRVIEVWRAVRRLRSATFSDKVTDAEERLSELCLHVFVKGWFGAIAMSLFVGVSFDLVWVYLAWSFVYDAVLRRERDPSAGVAARCRADSRLHRLSRFFLLRRARRSA